MVLMVWSICMNSSIIWFNLCLIYLCKVIVINLLFELFCDFVIFMNIICVIIFFIGGCI